MGLLIRLTIVPVVKCMVMGRWKHYSKIRRREFTALTKLYWGESLRFHIKAKEGHLLYSKILPGSYREDLWCIAPFLNQMMP